MNLCYFQFLIFLNVLMTKYYFVFLLLKFTTLKQERRSKSRDRKEKKYRHKDKRYNDKYDDRRYNERVNHLKKIVFVL